MASVSFGLNIGNMEQPDEITVGTIAVTTNDIEVLVDLTKVKTRNDVILALEAIIRKIENDGSVNLGVV